MCCKMVENVVTWLIRIHLGCYMAVDVDDDEDVIGSKDEVSMSVNFFLKDSL